MERTYRKDEYRTNFQYKLLNYNLKEEVMKDPERYRNRNWQIQK